MAGGSLLTLLDDIASVLDDVAMMTKLATKKTAGVLGDDLALNAQQVVGVLPERELPVVYAVARGSAKNKLILIPAALLISQLLPWAVLPLLMIGGAYLCFEGCEKLAHKWLHRGEAVARKEELRDALSAPEVDLVTFEREKIKGAVRTDFILSAEIITITLGTVAAAPFLSQLAVLVGIGAIMTVGVYGFVALIVKLDDIGVYLTASGASTPFAASKRVVGRAVVSGAPYLLKFLSVVGTAAMFMVGGGIIAHGVPTLHHAVEAVAQWGAAIFGGLHWVSVMISVFGEAILGVAVGVLLLGVVALVPHRRVVAH